MNGVLTHKELKALQKSKGKGAPKDEPKVRPAEPSAPTEVVSQEEHYLFHPDNPRQSSGYKEGKHILEIDGKKLSVPILGGVLRTDSVLAKNMLIQQGFVYMYTRPKGVDNE